MRKNQEYPVQYKGYKFTALKDAAGIDITFDEDIDNDGIEVAQELFNLIYDTMEEGHDLPTALLTLIYKGGIK